MKDLHSTYGDGDEDKILSYESKMKEMERILNQQRGSYPKPEEIGSQKTSLIQNIKKMRTIGREI